MRVVLKGKRDEPPKKLDNVIALQIDSLGGGLPVWTSKVGILYKGTEPTGPGSIYQKVKLSKHQSGKLCESVEIDARRLRYQRLYSFSRRGSCLNRWKNRWQEGISAALRSIFGR